MTGDICVVLGTRPGIVKFAPILHQLRAMSVPHFVVHSGQHYSANMDAVFFAEHGLVPPDVRVGRSTIGWLKTVRAGGLAGMNQGVVVKARREITFSLGDWRQPFSPSKMVPSGTVEFTFRLAVHAP